MVMTLGKWVTIVPVTCKLRVVIGLHGISVRVLQTGLRIEEILSHYELGSSWPPPRPPQSSRSCLHNIRSYPPPVLSCTYKVLPSLFQSVSVSSDSSCRSNRSTRQNKERWKTGHRRSWGRHFTITEKWHLILFFHNHVLKMKFLRTFFPLWGREGDQESWKAEKSL